MKKWFVRVSLSVAVGLLLILATAYWLVSTERGTRWLLETAVSYSNQKIELDQISGTLLSPLAIERAAYDTCNARITIENLKFHWQPDRLLQHTVNIQQLVAERVLVQTRADCEQPEKDSRGLPEKIVLPVAVQLDKLAIGLIKIEEQNQEQSQEQGHEVRQLSLVASTRDGLLDLELLNLDYETLNLQSTVTVEMQQPYELQGSAQWQYLVSNSQVYKGAVAMEGNTRALQVTHNLQQPYHIDTVVDLKNIETDLHFESASQWENLELPVSEDQVVSIRQGLFEAGGSLEAITYALDVRVDTSQAKDIAVSGQGTASRESVIVKPLTVQYQSATLTANGRVNLGVEISASLDITGDSINPALLLTGYPGDLNLDSHIEYVHQQNRNHLILQIRRLDGKLFDHLLAASGQVKTDLEQVQLDNLQIAVGENQVNVDGTIDKTVDLKASIQAPRLEQLLAGLTGDIQGMINVTGQISSPRLNVEATSGELHYQDIVHLRNADITAQLDSVGLDSPYRLDLVVDTEKADNVSVSAQGMMTGESVTLEPLALQHGGTNLKARGEIGLGSKLSASLGVVGEAIDPALLFADYPGNLNLDAQLEFLQQSEHSQLQLEINRLDGQLRNYMLYGSGQVHSDLETYNLDRVELSIGDNSIEINGVVGETIDIQANVHAPQIGQVFGDARGDLQGTVNAQGQIPELQLDADITSTELHYQDLFSLRDAVVSAHLDGDASQALDVDVDIKQLAVGDQSLESLNLLLKGTQQHHEIESSVQTEHGAVTLNASGAYLDESSEWHGQIDEVLLEETLLGDWRSFQQVEVIAGTSKQLVEGLCLKQAKQSVCMDYHNDGNKAQSIRARVGAFDLENVQSYIRDDILVYGLVNSDAELTADEQGIWTGRVEVKTDDVKLSPTQESGIDETLEFTELNANLELDDLSDLKINFDSNRGQGDVDLKIRSLQDIDAAEIVQGAMKMNIPELVFLNPYVDVLEIRDGQVNIDMQISGKLKKPLLQGAGEVESFRFYVPQLGTEFDDSDILITADDFAHLQIQGRMASGDGELTLQGNLQLDDPEGLNYSFSVSGENFQIMDSENIRASVSPDLRFQGDPHSLTISGSLAIPGLQLRMKELPQGVARLSEDEVIVNSTEELPGQSRFSLAGNIDLLLGEEVSFAGFGLETDLQGMLKIVLPENQATIGNGVLSLRDGKYNALGQTLEISKGDLIFSGPLDDPALDIRIERIIGDLTVAMLITGKTDNPHTRMISNPEVSDANKLSYLMTGRGVDDLSSGEGAALSNAALAMGLSRSSPVFQEIGAKLGIDTVALEAGESGLQSTSLLLGKHLSPRLYVSYARDLFSEFGAVQMNYRLSDHLSIEAESGSRQKMDLIYSFQKE